MSTHHSLRGPLLGATISCLSLFTAPAAQSAAVPPTDAPPVESQPAEAPLIADQIVTGLRSGSFVAGTNPIRETFTWIDTDGSWAANDLAGCQAVEAHFGTVEQVTVIDPHFPVAGVFTYDLVIVFEHGFRYMRIGFCETKRGWRVNGYRWHDVPMAPLRPNRSGQRAE